MAVHIGKIIQELISKRKLTAKEVAEFMNMSESNLFNIYTRPSVDIDKLGKFSVLLNCNLFEHYLSKAAVKKIFGQEFVDLENQIVELQNQLKESMEKARILSDTVETQKLALSLYQKQGSKSKK